MEYRRPHPLSLSGNWTSKCCFLVIFLTAIPVVCAQPSADGQVLQVSLNGSSLKCCSFMDEPYAYYGTTQDEDNSTKILGWAQVSFQNLQQHSNFNCSTHNHYNWAFSTPTLQRSYETFIDKFSTDYRTDCDLGIGAFKKSTHNFDKVHFLPPFGHTGFYILTKTSNDSAPFFISAFDRWVWTAILGIIVAFTFLHLLDPKFAQPKTGDGEGNQHNLVYSLDDSNDQFEEIQNELKPDNSTFEEDSIQLPVLPNYQTNKIKNRSAENSSGNETDLPSNESRVRRSYNKIKRKLLKNQFLFRLRYAVESTLTKLLGFPLGERTEGAQTMRMWLLSLTLTLCGIFLILVFEAAMIATLLSQNDENNQKRYGANHLYDCSIDDHKFCFLKDSSVDHFWNKTLSKQNCRDREGKKPKRLASYGAIIESLQNRTDTCEYALLDAGSTWKAYYNDESCNNLQIVGGPIVSTEVSLITHKDSKYKDSFGTSSFRLQINASTTLHDYMTGIYRDNKELRCSRTTDGTVMNFQRLNIFFYFIFGACVLFVLVTYFDPQSPIKSTEDQLEFNSQQNAADLRIRDINGYQNQGNRGISENAQEEQEPGNEEDEISPVSRPRGIFGRQKLIQSLRPLPDS